MGIRRIIARGHCVEFDDSFGTIENYREALQKTLAQLKLKPRKNAPMIHRTEIKLEEVDYVIDHPCI